MTAPELSNDLFSDFFSRLAIVHGIPQLEAIESLDGFSFTPEGYPYQLRVDPENLTQAFLEVDFLDLDVYLEDDTQKSLLERVLRSLLHLNETMTADHGWLISLDEQEVLILSRTVSLIDDSVESVQLLAIDGLQRANALRELCRGLALEPALPINSEANLWHKLV